MNWRDEVSIILQTLIFIISSLLLVVGAIKGGIDIGKLIFYAWLALATQQNIFHKFSLKSK